MLIGCGAKEILGIRYADDITLMEESEEEIKSLLMKVKVESEKLGFVGFEVDRICSGKCS